MFIFIIFYACKFAPPVPDPLFTALTRPSPPEELIGIMKIKAFVLFTILDNACWTAARLLLACVKVRGINKLKPIFKMFAECVD